MARNRSAHTSRIRRDKIRRTLETRTDPISATQLGKDHGVTRQVIVKDIALLRAEGSPIHSTHLGYVLARSLMHRRIFTVCHAPSGIEEELKLIIHHGGAIIDIQIDHPTYGIVIAPIDVTTSDDLNRFIRDFHPTHALANLTAGIHCHTVEAADEQTLDRIERALEEAEYLVKE
ncbi:MAG: transcription repressor NadR [Actinomycetaceae bacterium]|nr:transcription repressor NadR [Actinomycetaceae bacterium]